MSGSMSTTSNFIRRVEDVTFTGGRLQSEVAREIAKEMGEVSHEEYTHIPVSLTPSSIITFFEDKSRSPSIDGNERRVYAKAVELIKNRDVLKAEIKSLNDRLSRYSGNSGSESSMEGEDG